MDISTGWLKSDIYTGIYPWIYPWISISTASLMIFARSAQVQILCGPCTLRVASMQIYDGRAAFFFGDKSTYYQVLCGGLAQLVASLIESTKLINTWPG